MPSFKWTPKRKARLASAVRAFNAAITKRAKELHAQGQDEFVEFLPKKVTTAEIKERIRNTNDFRRIVGYKSDIKRRRFSELTRILKQADPHALDFGTKPGEVYSTRYSLKQYQYNKLAINRTYEKLKYDLSRKQFQDDDYFDFDNMSEQEYATVTSNTDIRGEDEGERDDSVVDVDEDTLNRWRQEDAEAKREQATPDAIAELYLKTWKDPMNQHHVMSGYQDMIDAIEWLIEHNTAALNKMFNSGRDEIDIPYIIPSERNNPYQNIDFEARHHRAVRYVTNYARHSGWRKPDEKVRRSKRDPLGELATRGYNYFI